MLFCLTGEYKPEAIVKLRENPDVTRQAAIEKLLKAAGCSLVAIYGRINHGPGAMVIFDAPDGTTAGAIVGVTKAAGHIENVTVSRLYTMEEVSKARRKAAELAHTFSAP